MSTVTGRNRSADAIPLGEETRQPVTAIYFRKASGDAMKRLAVRIRDSGVQTRLVWSHKFQGPGDINNQARAVIIEEGCPGQAKIALAYERYAHNVEIHYVDGEGQFVELSDEFRPDAAAAAVQAGGKGEVDPRDAVAALAASQEPDAEVLEPKPEETQPATDPVEDEAPDESKEPDENGGEDPKPEESDDDSNRGVGSDS